jgi:hypothetical protein
MDPTHLYLQIAVDDVPLVQVFESERDLCGVTLRTMLGEFPQFTEVKK